MRQVCCVHTERCSMHVCMAINGHLAGWTSCGAGPLPGACPVEQRETERQSTPLGWGRCMEVEDCLALCVHT